MTTVDNDSGLVLSDVEVTEFFGDKPIRWYQKACREGIIKALNDGIKRVIVVLPTGAGKTITVACSMSDQRVRDILGVKDGESMRVMFVSHKTRLLTQAEQAFADSSNVEIITQSMFSNIPAELIEKGWHITILDEGHHESCLSFQLQLEQLGEHPVIYITATPYRPDGLIIKANRLINPLSREQAVLEGYLAETELHSIVDTSAKDKTDMMQNVFSEFIEEMGQTMVFVRTKKEVQTISDFITKLGYKSVALLTQTDKQIDVILDQFSAGEVQFLINCNKISEGVDVKGCSDVVLAKQVGSYTLLNQIVGRAARPDSPCNVWEFVNPLSSKNLDTTVVVGTPKSHRLLFMRKGQWNKKHFNYTSNVR